MPKLDLDEDFVRKLAALLEETGLSEIEYEVDDRRIRVARGGTVIAQAAPAAAAPSAAAASAPSGGDAPHPGAVTSPMVGTVYTASDPASPPFVKVGDSVSEGQTLLIIEAMKVMNPLASPRSGTVTQFLVGDGEPVEYGEPLLVIE